MTGDAGAAGWSELPRQPFPPQLLEAAADRLEIISCSGPRHQILQAPH